MRSHPHATRRSGQAPHTPFRVHAWVRQCVLESLLRRTGRILGDVLDAAVFERPVGCVVVECAFEAVGWRDGAAPRLAAMILTGTDTASAASVDAGARVRVRCCRRGKLTCSRVGVEGQEEKETGEEMGMDAHVFGTRDRLERGTTAEKAQCPKENAYESGARRQQGHQVRRQTTTRLLKRAGR